MDILTVKLGKSAARVNDQKASHVTVILFKMKMMNLFMEFIDAISEEG